MATGGHRQAAATLCALLAIVSAPAHADVFEVATDGALVVRAGPGAVGLGEPDDGVPATALTLVSAAPAPAAYADALSRAAVANDLSPALLAALVWQESRWQPGAVSPKGAIGLAQLMPRTARELAVDPRDAAANIAGGARYLRLLYDRFGGDIEQALAAYNAGPARVARTGGVPAIAETRAYVAAISTRLSDTAIQGH